MKEFKVGDKVYCPSISTEILTIKTLPKDVMVVDITQTINELGCGFVTYLNSGNIIRLKDGKCMKTFCPKVIHATPENHELLEKLYGVEFEKPHANLTSIKIIQAMLARGDKCVCCWVDDYNENPTIDNTWGFIIDYDGSSLPFNDSNGSGWRYATPFDPKTGEVITELPE